MRCPHCPAPAGELCRGEANPHFCHLVDPANPNRNTDYARILVKDDVQVTDEMREQWLLNAMVEDPDVVERSTKPGCCG